MNETTTKDKDGLGGAACSPSSLTPETDKCRESMDYIRPDGTCRIDAMADAMRKMESSMRKLYEAYKQKVRGEMQIGHFDKGALTLLAEIQREHPSLQENTQS